MTTKTPFKKTWNKLMAKETTTTFTVTVTHSGVHMPFWELFTTCGRHKSSASVQTAEVDTSTKAVPAKEKWTPEQRMGRMLIKESCEKAGLKFKAGAHNIPIEHYNLKYHKYAYKGGRTGYVVTLAWATIELDFPKGIGRAGALQIREGTNRWSSNDPTIDVHFGSPDVVDNMTAIFKRFGNGTAPDRSSLKGLQKISLGEFVKQHLGSI